MSKMAGKYEKLSLLGTGSFGQAWLVNDEDNVKCVLKEIRLTTLSDKEIDQALVEVTVLAKCRHVNVVKYQEAFVKEKCLNIVMEYADGGDLQKKIQAQRGIHFAKEIVFDWFVQIVFALKYIHSKNILHRDLKPQNVFLTTQNIVKLGDFGISRILQSSNDHALTTIGTPYYLSPEICQKKPYNHKSDIWALGCILYELCCLRVPFDAPDLTALVLKIVEGKFQPVPSHYGPLIEDLVSVLLKPNPDLRPSAEQILAVPKLQPMVDRILKGHLERKRINSDITPKCGGPSNRKLCKEADSPSTPDMPNDRPSPPNEDTIVSPMVRARRGSVAKVKVTGRRLSVPSTMKLARRHDSNTPPVRILNGRVISPCISENDSSPGSDCRDSPECNKPGPKFQKKGPVKTWESIKENIVFPATYRVNKSHMMRRHSLFTPAISHLIKKQKEKEVQSCRVPKRIEREKVGPPPTLNLFRNFLASRSESDSPPVKTPVASPSVNYATDDDVFDSECKQMMAPASKSQESLSSLTYKIGGLRMDESPETAVRMPETAAMKQHQVLYESVIANHGNTRQAVVSLTTYLQEQLGAPQFQQLYNLVLESAKSATDFKILREKAGEKIVYLPLIIHLLQLERVIG